ncbi:EscU/YscU/HrcU family type III secretion system export apparatus switch protein [Ferrimonas balearica]|uniref:EscU/YscU/HrcU family type III secretion system export apparatus switch protein n=1 Tax=Ferrimonas balearica TaxID=44012 RepID=UPI001C57B940|nr:EscU/YscU/HrcU family type III secretion system export apparatus switch protein [Ferrimonas balearica]MBW3138178.1 EscU/YscU/HrcU family type III secretion system export apparatus switch protein [Ferrimonas balearica]MBY6105243.1 EscU/YscU/HrcU family type III secretion system export apparatus switch protein [Ferrimonas balearica]
MPGPEHGNATDKAVALGYDGKDAPKVVASGEGELARQIRRAAEEAGVLVHQDAQLAHLLSQLELGQSIPPALYVVIAELIAYAYLVEGRFPEQWNNIHQRIDAKA